LAVRSAHFSVAILVDATASYALVWWSGVGLAALAAVLVLPLREGTREMKMA